MSDPLPAPTAAVGGVSLRGDEVLLIRRGTPPRRGEWSLPGGRIEPGERVMTRPRARRPGSRPGSPAPSR